jgi:ATP dependent DNA ligase-like protein
MAFDVLSVDGRKVTRLPYVERRAILEDLRLDDRFWQTPESFDDGGPCWRRVCEHELVGVVSKNRSGRYLPGERGSLRRTARPLPINNQSAGKGQAPSAAPTIPPRTAWISRPPTHASGLSRNGVVVARTGLSSTSFVVTRVVAGPRVPGRKPRDKAHSKADERADNSETDR